jgi:hypothetical protein
MNAKPTLRLQILIAREIKRVGNPTRLAQLIAEANEDAGWKRKVDRRTLTNLSKNPDKVAFTLDMLAALNEYFKLLGEGLDRVPMLVTRGLLEPLVDARRLVFMTGAKPRPAERRVDWSRWDGLALAELAGEASRFNRRHEFDIEDVLWRNPVDALAIQTETWYSLLDVAGTSVISIGSPIAALSSEVMLARMFNVEPFVRPHFAIRSPLPFYFVWMPRVARGFRSAFGLTWRELGTDFAKLGQAVRANRSAAFFLNGVPHPVPAKAKDWTMHGVIAAQRRASGSVWLVVSGLAGPATLAAARLVKFVDAELPVCQHQNSPVLWMPIKAFIKVGRPSSVVSGDLREIVDVEPVGESRFWPKPAV